MQNRFSVGSKGASRPRHELKYYVSEPGHAILRSLLSATMRKDAHGDANNDYFIRSLYFDDAYDRAYYQKMDGAPDRDKYRIRIYHCSDEEIFLERKRKTGDLIDKSSVRVTRRLCDQLIAGVPDGLDRSQNPLIRDVFREMRLNALKPAVIVDYVREAYTHPAEDVRVTFDKELKSGLFSSDLFDPDLPMVSPLEPGRMILEVKYNRYLPDHVRALLSSVPSQCSAISKYTLCRRFEPLAVQEV